MARDDIIPIAPAPSASPSSAPAPTLNLKSFRLVDLYGNVVELQGLALVDGDGRPVNPMTEDTGQKLLRMLKHVNNTIAIGFNLDAQVVSEITDEAPDA